LNYLEVTILINYVIIYVKKCYDNIKFTYGIYKIIVIENLGDSYTKESIELKQ